jgi:uncharacterized phage protein (TIGR01671 family)
MQREIKFRGKRVDTKEWVYGYYYYDIGRNRHMIWTHEQYGEGLCDNTYEVIPETVGEYTGLKDKNGKEIYEGDIVVFEDMTSTESGYWERDCIGIVVWGEETAAFEVTNRLSAESYEVLSDCEVIGDIYTTPELLEVSE